MSALAYEGRRGPQGDPANGYPLIWKVQAPTDALNTGDGLDYLFIPPELNGANLVVAHAALVTPGTGTTTIQIRNVTQTADMLSTRITIDSAEQDSSTASPSVIDTANDDVAQFDKIACDIDAAAAGAKGLVLLLRFEVP